jgi:capsular exopolysaccharide synthesis family protein
MEQASHDPQALDLDKLLETIHERVDQQVAGLDSSLPAPQAEAVLHGPQEDPSPACTVMEFPTERYRQIHVSRACERVFFPENETIPAPPALEAYRSLRTRLLRLQAKRAFRTVAISSSEQNEGKTLTSLNLAICCAQLPQYPVLVVDGDLRRRGLSQLLGDLDGPGLGELLAGRVAREAAVLATDIPNLHVVAAGKTSTPPPELFTQAAWKEFLSWCKESFKLVLVDCPPALPLADFELISASAESVLLVVRARVSQRQSLQRVLAHVDPAKLLGIALNSVPHTDHNSYYYYHDYGSRGSQRNTVRNLDRVIRRTGGEQL